MKDRITYLLNRYRQGSHTDAEYRELLQLVEDMEHDVLFKQLLDAAYDGPVTRRLAAGRAGELYQQLTGHTPTQGRQRKGRAFWWSAAAVLLLSAAVWWWQPRRSTPSAVYTEVRTMQEHQLIVLPDSSTVILNAGSRLDYPVTFTGEQREVTLDGEGYFDIRPLPDKPFMVRTGKLITRVLGTAFNIRAYGDAPEITVTVTRGKVSVGDAEKTFGIVEPNQQLTFDREVKHYRQQVVDAKAAIAWQEHDLFFNDITLSEAIRQLEERFGVRIRLERAALGQQRFTATFLKGEDIEEVLTVICAFNDVQYRREGNNGLIIY